MCKFKSCVFYLISYFFGFHNLMEMMMMRWVWIAEAWRY
jgi:hypothetical protein